MQQPIDQSVGQRKDVIALVPGQYLDIALGQCKIYFSAMAFDLPMQSVTYVCIYLPVTGRTIATKQMCIAKYAYTK